MEFPSQLYTSSVEEYVNRGGVLLKTTSYGYSFKYGGNHQIINSETRVDDGRSITTHRYTTTKKKRTTYLTRVDYFLSFSFFMAPATFREIVPYETGYSVATRGGDVLEDTSLVYDLETMRLISRVVTRGDNHSLATTWTHDVWGNVTATCETARDDDVVASRTTETIFFIRRYLGQFLNDRSEDSPYDVPVLSRPRMDLPIHQRVRYSIPEAAGGATEGSQNTWYQYDGLGRKLAETAEVGGRQLETRYDYDACSDLIRTVSPVSAGKARSTRIARDYAPANYYDVRTTTEDVELTSGTTADLESAAWYDRFSGLKIFERDAWGYLSAWEYDAVGRPTRVIKPDDTDPLNADPLQGTAFVADNPTTTIVYDDVAYTVTVTGARGQQTVYDFDQAGRLEKITSTVRKLDEAGLPLATGAQVQETLAGYDAWGNITSIVDPNGHRTDYRYDATGRLSAIEYPADSGPRPSKTIVFDYGANRQVTTDERGYVSIEQFDMCGRRIGTTAYPDQPGGVGHEVTTSTAFDGLGRESVTTDELGGITIKRYDERGKPIEIVSPASTFFEGGIERIYAPRKVMTYDDAGFVLSEGVITGEGTFLTRYSNNQIGLPLSLERPYTDRTGETTAETLARELYGYDANGNRISTVDANDSIRLPAERKPRTVVYSARGKVLAETDRAGNQTTYTYDADDNVMVVTDPRGNDPTYRGKFAGRFWYDDANRLVRAIIPSAEGGDGVASVSFDYDPRGNLIRRVDADGSVTTCTYSSRNKPVTELRSDQDRGRPGADHAEL